MTGQQPDRPLPAIPTPSPTTPTVTNFYAPRSVVYHSISDDELDSISSVTPIDLGFFTFCFGIAIGAVFALVSALRANPIDGVMVALSAPCLAVFAIGTAVFFFRWRAAEDERTRAIARIRRADGR